MDCESILVALLVSHLADRLQVRLALDVAHGAAHLDDDDLGSRLAADGSDALLDLVCDVGNGLDRPAQVVAAALLADDGLIDLAGGHRGAAGQVLVQKALVVTQVKVRLGTVGGDVHLPVLIGGHGAGVDVEIGIDLLDDDGDVAGLEDSADGSGGDALAYRTDNTAGYEYVLGAHLPPFRGPPQPDSNDTGREATSVKRNKATKEKRRKSISG